MIDKFTIFRNNVKIKIIWTIFTPKLRLSNSPVIYIKIIIEIKLIGIAVSIFLLKKLEIGNDKENIITNKIK